jgi:hypothetical protein
MHNAVKLQESTANACGVETLCHQTESAWQTVSPPRLSLGIDECTVIHSYMLISVGVVHCYFQCLYIEFTIISLWVHVVYIGG